MSDAALSMSALRWALLLIGVPFLGVLTWWELRRSRQRNPQRDAAGLPLPSADGHAPPHAYREPTLTLPEIRPRETPHELPVVEIADSLSGLRAGDESGHMATGEEAAAADVAPTADQAAVPERAAGAETAARSGERTASDELSRAEETPGFDVSSESEEASEDEVSEDEVSESDATSEFEATHEFEETAEAEAAVEPIIARAPEPAAPVHNPFDSDPLAALTRVDPIVEWPEESERRIVALRLVASGERLPGRAVRQALAAEGFVLGKFSIFHRAAPDGRALVSAASLNRPGTFDDAAIDMQRFGGLNLFTVLPGPLPSVRAFEELLSSARGLNARLCGALQDERGEPLTPTRAAAIRDMLAAAEPAAGASESAHSQRGN